jgi:hypothetical protein
MPRAKVLCGLSGCLGAGATGLGFYFHSWTVFFIAIAIVIPLDYWMDFHFQRLAAPDQK